MRQVQTLSVDVRNIIFQRTYGYSSCHKLLHFPQNAPSMHLSVCGAEKLTPLKVMSCDCLGAAPCEDFIQPSTLYMFLKFSSARTCHRLVSALLCWNLKTEMAHDAIRYLDFNKKTLPIEQWGKH